MEITTKYREMNVIEAEQSIFIHRYKTNKSEYHKETLATDLFLKKKKNT